MLWDVERERLRGRITGHSHGIRFLKYMEDIDVLLSDGGPIDGALAEIYREADETLVAGSLYLAGAARSLVREGALEGIRPGQGPAEEA